MKTFAIAALIASATAFTPMNGSESHQRFMDFIVEEGKSYGTQEELEFRFVEFMKTEAAMEVLNSIQDSSVHGHNFMSDWTEEERTRILGTFETEDLPMYGETHYASEGFEASNAGSVDWRQHGAVTGVKNQGQCGSCWSFSTTGAMEGAHKIASGNLLSLSEQQFVDCSTRNSGCNGGWPTRAFEYAESNPIELETNYRYTGRDGRCSYSKSKGEVSVRSYKNVSRNSSSALLSAIQQQPVSVVIAASSRAFQSYTSGVLSTGCGTRTDHAVLAVGYGSQGGQQYYIVKNSWGTRWGDNGYIKIAVESGAGVCGIQTGASYPSTN